MIHVDPPFDLGSTLKGTDDDGNLVNESWEGAVFYLPDVDRTPAVRGGKGRRTGRMLKAVIVRNTSGSAISAPAGKLYRFDIGQTGRKVIGSIDDAAGAEEWAGVVDPELGSDDVASNDLCWLVVEGVVSLTDSGSGISAGDPVVCAASGDIATGAASAVELIGHALDAIGANATGLVSLNVRI